MKNARGLTLVELMIVVAIIGILAALGSVAYGRYIKSAKIEKLQQMALDVQSGQERFRSRNNVYWNGGPWSAGAVATNYTNLLDFSKDVLPPETTLNTQAWVGGIGTCTICQGAPFDATQSGYAVVVTQDLSVNDAANTTIIVTNSTESPLLLFEGQ